MKLADLVNKLGLDVKSASGRLGNKVTGGYISDLLSDVIAHGNDGDIWITLQAHLNIVAVASMKNLAGIILVNGRQPEQDTIERAETEEIPVMVSPLPAFELVGRLYDLGIRPAGEQRASEAESD